MIEALIDAVDALSDDPDLEDGDADVAVDDARCDDDELDRCVNPVEAAP